MLHSNAPPWKPWTRTVLLLVAAVSMGQCTHRSSAAEWVAHGDFEYKVLPDRSDYVGARAACAEMRAFIAIPHNADENNFLYNFYRSSGIGVFSKLWVGTTDAENPRTWISERDNKRLTFSAWKRGEPSSYSQHCAVFRRQEWRDVWCDNHQRVICQRNRNDTTPPAITLRRPETGEHIPNSRNTYAVEVGHPFSPPLASAEDARQAEVTLKEPSNRNSIDTEAISHTQQLTYMAWDAVGNRVTRTITVIVQDTKAPAITLNGELIAVVETGQSFLDIDPGVDVWDLWYTRKDLILSIDYGEYTDVPATTPAAFTVQYTVRDPSGNSNHTHRTVVVVDTTPPDLTLSGEAEVRVPYATRYREPGYTAVDTHDGDVTGAVVVSGADVMDTHVAGTYDVTYSVLDVSGNQATEIRRVVVEARPQPEALDGLVVELVLAGTPERLFNNDERELEMQLETALSVDFVVVFLFYDKLDGRPSSTTPTASATRRRRLLAGDKTVVEFGVRDAATLAWQNATSIVDQMLANPRLIGTGLVLDVSPFAPSPALSFATSTEPASAASGAVAGLFILWIAVAIVAFAWRRYQKQKATPIDDSSGSAEEDSVAQQDSSTFVSLLQEQGEVGDTNLYDGLDAEAMSSEQGRSGQGAVPAWSSTSQDVARHSTRSSSSRLGDGEDVNGADPLRAATRISPATGQTTSTDHQDAGQRSSANSSTADPNHTRATRPASIHSWSTRAYDVHNEAIYESVDGVGDSTEA